MKKKIIIALIILTVLGLLLMGMIILSAAEEYQKAAENAKEGNIITPCEITGSVKGDRIDLILSYDGMEITGIKGSVVNGSFKASHSSDGKVPVSMDLPGPPAKLNVKTFMSYQAVVSRASAQYKLLNSEGAKDDGIYRKVNGRYCIALGSFYGTKIGTEYVIEFSQRDGSTKSIRAVLGDCKSDRHTDSKHQYMAGGYDHGKYYKPDYSVLEFITAAGTASGARVSATQSTINHDFGTIKAIYKTSGAAVSLSGTIKSGRISITGSVDGQPITAEGTVKDGKVSASGYIGTMSGMGSGDIVAVAKSQLGQKGGKPYWSWYGFNSHVWWCSCFVSWCANECGYIKAGIIPKFCLCANAVKWFQKRHQFQPRTSSYLPKAGDIIFYDWDGDKIADHVGIVEKSTKSKVYTIEGNCGDECKARQRDINYSCILGYGLPNY